MDVAHLLSRQRRPQSYCVSIQRIDGRCNRVRASTHRWLDEAPASKGQFLYLTSPNQAKGDQSALAGSRRRSLPSVAMNQCRVIARGAWTPPTSFAPGRLFHCWTVCKTVTEATQLLHNSARRSVNVLPPTAYKRDFTHRLQEWLCNGG
jgi:hypothetical protein